MLKRLKHKVVTSIKSGKFNVFLLFLFFALVILFLSKLTKTHTKTIAFKVNTINMPQEYVMLNKDSMLLDITLKAQGYKLLGYYFKTPKIDLDFKTLEKLNDSIYYWDKRSNFLQLENNFGEGMEIAQVKPDRLLLQYDVNDIIKVPVVLNSRIEFSQGFDLFGRFQLTPDSVTIIGPKSEISKINFIKTDTLSLKSVNSDIFKKVRLLMPQDYDKFKISNNSVEVSGSVEKFSEGTLKVPIVLKNVPINTQIKTFPREVMVTFYTSLTNFNEVKAKDFKVECDYNLVTKEKPYLEPKLVAKPDIVKSARVNQERVEFILN